MSTKDQKFTCVSCIIFSNLPITDRHRTVVNIHFIFYCGLNCSIPRVTNQGVLAIFHLGMTNSNLQTSAYISLGFLACVMAIKRMTSILFSSGCYNKTT